MITVLFFGELVEIVGTNKKIVVDFSDINSLKSALLEEFPLLEKKYFQIALNSKLTQENCNLKSGDELAFLPQFAGG